MLIHGNPRTFIQDYSLIKATSPWICSCHVHAPLDVSPFHLLPGHVGIVPPTSVKGRRRHCWILDSQQAAGLAARAQRCTVRKEAKA